MIIFFNNIIIIFPNEIIIINKEDYQNDIFFEKEEILFYTRKSFKTGLYELINPVRKKMIKNKNNIDNLNNRLWYVVKSKKENDNNNEDYNINENDIIKLGRRKFEVIKKNITSYNNIISYENEDNYNISEINKRTGSIFDINIKPNQYKITEKELPKEETEQQVEIKNKENKYVPLSSDIQNNKETDKQSNNFDKKD